jgi:hypothetical protein
MKSFDDRIPVLFGGEPGADEAVLAEGAWARGLAGHVPGCACCAPRGGAAEALRAFYLARARGERDFALVRVRASAAGEALVRVALAGDLFVAGRFRAGE